MTFIWGKISKNGPSKICERQPLKNFKYGLSSTNFTWSILGPFLNFILLDIFSFQKSIACLLKYYLSFYVIIILQDYTNSFIH